MLMFKWCGNPRHLCGGTESSRREGESRKRQQQRENKSDKLPASAMTVVYESPPGFAVWAREIRCWLSHNGSVLLWWESQELLHLQSWKPRRKKDQWCTFPEIEGQGFSHKVNGASLPELWAWTGHLFAKWNPSTWNTGGVTLEVFV